jgi:hypothetical protein
MKLRERDYLEATLIRFPFCLEVIQMYDDRIFLFLWKFFVAANILERLKGIQLNKTFPVFMECKGS